MSRVAEEWEISFISPSDVEQAMESLRDVTLGLADETEPTCLISSAMQIRDAGPIPHQPVDCGQPSNDDNHSIQENGLLSRLVNPSDKSKSVLQFFPTALSLATQLKQPGKHPGTEFIWDHTRLAPKPVSISRASVRHFACGDHDGHILGEADNLRFPATNSYLQIVDEKTGDTLKPFARTLHRLAYRTLLFRISQFRGTELVAAEKLKEQIKAGNRFAVDTLLDNLKELSSVSLELHRHKLLFDQDLVASKRFPLVHHIAPFDPIIRYAASEYLPMQRPQVKGKEGSSDAYVSMNVIPDGQVTWYVLSHPANYSRFTTSTIANHVRDFTCQTPDLRKRFDLDSLSNLTNIYASPVDYWSLDECDRETVERSLAWRLCEQPYEKTLKFLESTPKGSAFIRRIRSELARNE